MGVSAVKCSQPLPAARTPAPPHGAAWLGTALLASPGDIGPGPQIAAANRALFGRRVLPKSDFSPKLPAPGPARSQHAQLLFGSGSCVLCLCCFAKRRLFAFACGDKGFPSTGANLFYLLPAPNSPQICRLRSAPDSARTRTAISLSAFLFVIEVKLIRKGKGKKDLSACLAPTQSGWKGAGLE